MRPAPNTCPYCGEVFTTNANYGATHVMYSHMYWSHGWNELGDVLKRGKLIYRCKFCLKGFADYTYLVEHIRSYSCKKWDDAVSLLSISNGQCDGSTPPVPRKPRSKKPKPTAVQARACRAAKNLARWQKRLALVRTKVKTYEQRVRYYQKKGVSP